MTGEEIRELRDKKLGMTQSEFAQALGLSFTTISRWETSKAEPDDKQEEQLVALKEIAEKKEVNIKKLRKLLMNLGIAGIIPLAVLGGLPLLSGLAAGASALLGGRVIGAALLNLFTNEAEKSKPTKKEE